MRIRQLRFDRNPDWRYWRARAEPAARSGSAWPAGDVCRHAGELHDGDDSRVPSLDCRIAERQAKAEYYEQVKEAADAVKSRLGETQSIGVGVVLGSGLGAFVEPLDDAVSMAYEQRPRWPPSGVRGQGGGLGVGKGRGGTICALSGRSHVYERHGLRT